MKIFAKLGVITLVSLLSVSSVAGSSSPGEDWIKVADTELKSGINNINIDNDFRNNRFDMIKLKPMKENMKIRDLFVIMKGDDGATSHQMFGLLRKGSFSQGAVVNESNKSIASFTIYFDKNIANSINFRKSSIEIWAHKA